VQGKARLTVFVEGSHNKWNETDFGSFRVVIVIQIASIFAMAEGDRNEKHGSRMR
jgi:hypothetical protein